MSDATAGNRSGEKQTEAASKRAWVEPVLSTVSMKEAMGSLTSGHGNDGEDNYGS